MRRLAVPAVAVLAVGTSLLTMPAAESYCTSGYTWNRSTLEMRSGSSIPGSWDDTLRSSANAWNDISGANWTLKWRNKSFTGPTPVTVSKQASAPPGFKGNPAVTDIVIKNGYIVGGNIYFNNSWSWNFDGTMNFSKKKADVRTIAVHEMGHETHLNHPSACGAMNSAEKKSAMNPAGVKRQSINSDDREGVHDLK